MSYNNTVHLTQLSQELWLFNIYKGMGRFPFQGFPKNRNGEIILWERFEAATKNIVLDISEEFWSQNDVY